jgi:membrane associated rhomboid family serine protease
LFIPIHDGNPLRHVPFPAVTWGVIAANVLVFLVLERAGSTAAVQASALSFGAIPAVITDAASLSPELVAVPTWATLFTYAFLHASWLHLLGNMLFVWVFGDNVEDAMGHVRFLAFYLAAAAAAAGAHVLVSPSSEAPLIGASGAVAAIIGAYLMLHPHVRLWVLAFGRIPLRLPALWVLGAWLALQVWSALTDGDGDVAWWAHIGGFLVGAGLVVVLRRRGVPLFDRGLAATR